MERHNVFNLISVLYDEYPTLRAGQFLSNLMEQYKQDNRCDIFYIDDEKFIDWVISKLYEKRRNTNV